MLTKVISVLAPSAERSQEDTLPRLNANLSRFTQLDSVQIMPGESALALGQGYNALTGKFLPNVAVKADGPLLTLSGAGYNHEFINVVDNMATNSSASGSSAGFDVVYKLISVGFSTGSSSSNYFNSIDQFGRVYKRILTRGVAIPRGIWSNDASSALGDMQDFVRQFGTHYIRGLYYGHVLDQELRFKMTTDITKDVDRKEFQLGVKGIFGFSYGDATIQTKVDSHSTTTAVDNSMGIINIIPLPTNAGGVQTLVKYARETFPEKVAASKPEDAALLSAELVPYYALSAPGAENFPDWPDDIMDNIVARQPIYELFLSALSDLNYALALDPAALPQVYKEAKPTLDAKLTTAIAKQDSFRNAAKDCNELLKNGADDPVRREQCKQNLLNAITAKDIRDIAPTPA